MTVKHSHVLAIPSAPASVGPETVVVPRLPTISAVTIRGETPRRTTVIDSSVPRRRPPSFAAAARSESVTGPKRLASNGSATACSQGWAAAPMNAFWMSSVSPPELAK